MSARSYVVAPRQIRFLETCWDQRDIAPHTAGLLELLLRLQKKPSMCVAARPTGVARLQRDRESIEACKE
jgi:hypothetical protein